MDANSLKTSWKQRIFIVIIAILLLGSTVAAYVAIVVSSGNQKSTTALEEEYTAKQTEINDYAASLSAIYYSTLSNFRSEVKSYNAAAANNAGVQKKDLKTGDGRELTTGDTNYFAYYIGWCPDESVFDSSFDDFDNPTSLKAPLYAGQGLIEGWNQGVIGMKIGGVREITIPNELAYGDSTEICNSTSSPLKFIVLPITDEKLTELEADLEEIYGELINAYYSSASTTTTTTTSGE